MSSQTLLLLVGAAVLLLAASTGATTTVTSCLTDDDASQTVTISGCTTGTCKLKRGSTVSLEVEFTAIDEAESLTNQVTATVLGISVKWAGVSGTDATSEVYNTDGTAATFPLTTGEKYIYKNSFDVSTAYPKISTTVKWALKSNTKTYPVCFKVKAKITS